jgi:hypothetical protein
MVIISRLDQCKEFCIRRSDTTSVDEIEGGLIAFNGDVSKKRSRERICSAKPLPVRKTHHIYQEINRDRVYADGKVGLTSHEVRVILQNEYRELDTKNRKKYEDLHVEDKNRHAEEMIAYKSAKPLAYKSAKPLPVRKIHIIYQQAMNRHAEEMIAYKSAKPLPIRKTHILYQQINRDRVYAEGKVGLTYHEALTILQNEYRELDTKDKKKYEDLHVEDKNRHAKEMIAYEDTLAKCELKMKALQKLSKG